LRLADAVGETVVVHGGGEPPDVHLEVVDGCLIEVVHAEHNVAVAVLPSAEIAQVLIAGDPRPGRRVGEAQLRDVMPRYGGEIKHAPPAPDHIVPKDEGNATVEHVRVRRLQGELFLEEGV